MEFPDWHYRESFDRLPEGVRPARTDDFKPRTQQLGMRLFIKWPGGGITAFAINPCTTGLGHLLKQNMLYIDEQPKTMTGPTNWEAVYGKLEC